MSTLFPSGSAPAPKVKISVGQLPGYVSFSQAPTKRPPWQIIREIPYGDSVTVTLPHDLHRIIWDSVEADISRPKYAKVIMKLEEVLKGEFFTEYIKKGNVLMISEGEPGVNDNFSLREGVLRLELSKESYEQAGLQGVPMSSSGGRKHVKLRYLVEINLRLPSMLHGKQGFDRLMRAAQRTLNKSMNWLFLDLDRDLDQNPLGPLSAHHPTEQTLTCSRQELLETMTPSLLTGLSSYSSDLSLGETQESIYEVLEYLDMVALASPRVRTTDQIDSFLSRYAVPDPSESSNSVKAMTWNGLISSQWILELVCSIIKQSRVKNLQNLDFQQNWLAISVSSFKTQAVHQTDGYTILLQPSCGDQPWQDSSHDSGGPTKTGETGIEMDDQHRDDPDPGGIVTPDIGTSGRLQQISHVVISRAGFQRFLCAEYTDNLR
ncbi:hypothetical protein PV04_06810 [Phialophora macrospora]|uniref:Uncharacterized protein n=1 Tax=Phialophora macrospora TaxID=1851006 RepID=A0A0D2FLI1_9EURO|nr:hypothetical protein PV04_06810 [Phialophora macrospora]